jgi:predicted ATPase/DNA-binding CsgD family transcriptional regulator
MTQRTMAQPALSLIKGKPTLHPAPSSQHNLPAQTTTFIGRDAELQALDALIADPSVRLLTICGPGGIGKTRLAIEVAQRNQLRFADGVVFVPLQSARSADDIFFALTEALGLSLTGREPPSQQVLSALLSRRVLLVLDNAEYVSDEAEHLSELLVAPALKLLVTSREALRLREEWLYPLRGLNVSDDADAIRLFVERARQVRHTFALEDERAAVAQICRLVEGMPLAIELAAAWTGAVSCRAIAEEIQNNLDFLTARVRNAPDRHRSIRIVCDQSWALLDAQERAVFAQLSVFAGGFSREAASAVAGAALPMLDALAHKSLIWRASNERYHIHELLRQYAEERFHAAPGAAAPAEARYIAFFLALAESAEPELRGPNQQSWLTQLAVEHENLRAAIKLAQAAGDAETTLRLTGAIFRFWWLHGHVRLGRSLLAQALSMPVSHSMQAHRIARAKALNGAGVLAWAQGDFVAAQAYHQEALELWRALDDPVGVSRALHDLGLIARAQGKYAEARTLYEECLTIKREIGDLTGLALTLNSLAVVVTHQEDIAAAHALFTESLAVARSIGDQTSIALALSNLGQVALFRGDCAAARSYSSESLAIARQIGASQPIAGILHTLGMVCLVEGAYAEARDLLLEALTLLQQIGAMRAIFEALEGLACLAVALGAADVAARLFGAAEVLRTRRRTLMSPPEYALLAPYMELAQTQLGDVGWSSAWAAGRRLSPDKAIELALGGVPGTPQEAGADTAVEPSLHQRSDAANTDVEALTEREMEILGHIAAGRSNQEIAEALVFSIGTVKWYTSQIYGKLGVRSRTQAIACARELGLLRL